MHKEYSGFIEFNFEKKPGFHDDAVKLNCARQGVNYIIKANNYKKIFIPYYICDTVYKALEIDYEFYYLDKNLLPKITPELIKKNSAILYPNYFGTNDANVKKVLSSYSNVIVDNTQAFYQKLKNCDVVYSPRKFFWVTDGCYTYCQKKFNIELERDVSHQRMAPLFKRIECGANAAYKATLDNEEEITNSGMKKMSLLTEMVLHSIDYKKMANIRKKNFNFLHGELAKINELKLIKATKSVPMVYPLLINNSSLRTKLIEKHIYLPSWWKTVIEKVSPNSYENYLSNNLLPLPIDHRYDVKDMKFIVGQILKELK